MVSFEASPATFLLNSSLTLRSKSWKETVPTPLFVEVRTPSFLALMANADLVISRDDHDGLDYSEARVYKPLRQLWYDWKDVYARYYIDPSSRFAYLLRNFIDLVDLPFCALRLVGNCQGKFIMPAVIERLDAQGSKARTDQDCMVDNQPITDEFACRLMGVNVPDYRTTFLIVPHTNKAVDYSLVVEKQCMMDTFAARSFHEDEKTLMMTGCGFPDDTTKAMVKYMELYFDRPVQGLSDLNPSGAQLLNSYNHVDRPTLPHLMFNTKLGWLGAHPRFMSRFLCTPNNGYSIYDRNIIRYLLDPLRKFSNGNTDEAKRRRRHLRRMLLAEDKYDLDSLPSAYLVQVVAWFLKNPNKIL